MEPEKAKYPEGRKAPINIDELRHPSEYSRYILAMVVVAIIGIILVVLIFLTSGALLLVLGLIVLGAWIATEVLKAHLVGSSVRVSEENFPQVHSLVEQIKRDLEYPESIGVYVVEKGEVNTILYKLFRTRMIILYSGLLQDMLADPDRTQLTWIIARSIGHLKAKHLRFTLIRILIDSLEKPLIFNLLLYPYERATQYSGDQIGLAVCSDLKASLMAMNKFLAGNKLSKQVQLSGLLQQYDELHGNFFSVLAELLSPYPHLVKRVANILVFSKRCYPEMYDSMIAELDETAIHTLEYITKRELAKT